MKALFIFTLLLAGCKEGLDQWLISYPKEVSEGVELFLDYAPSNIKAKRLTIILTGEIFWEGGQAAGLTRYKEKTILLDTTSSYYIGHRKALILHELGHYVLNREHEKRRDSLMNPWYFPTDEEINDPVVLEAYMVELFNL